MAGNLACLTGIDLGPDPYRCRYFAVGSRVLLLTPVFIDVRVL